MQLACGLTFMDFVNRCCEVMEWTSSCTLVWPVVAII